MLANLASNLCSQHGQTRQDDGLPNTDVCKGIVIQFSQVASTNPCSSSLVAVKGYGAGVYLGHSLLANLQTWEGLNVACFQAALQSPN